MITNPTTGRNVPRLLVTPTTDVIAISTTRRIFHPVVEYLLPLVPQLCGGRFPHHHSYVSQRQWQRDYHFHAQNKTLYQLINQDYVFSLSLCALNSTHVHFSARPFFSELLLPVCVLLTYTGPGILFKSFFYYSEIYLICAPAFGEADMCCILYTGAGIHPLFELAITTTERKIIASCEIYPPLPLSQLWEQAPAAVIAPAPGELAAREATTTTIQPIHSLNSVCQSPNLIVRRPEPTFVSFRFRQPS